MSYHQLSLVFALLLPAATANGEATQFGGPALPRADFNRLAVQARLPLFWTVDKDKDGLVDAAELAVVGTNPRLSAQFIRNGKLTRKFVQAYRDLVQRARREAVAMELDAGRPTLVESDLLAAFPRERKLLKILLEAGAIVQELYLVQTGADRFIKQLPRVDTPSRALFRRNHGPWCITPATTGNRFCNAMPKFPPRRSDAYPTDMAQDGAMCKMLEQHVDAKNLLNPFVVVRREGRMLKPVPLNKVYAQRMGRVAKKLRAAARVLDGDSSEQALQRYLLEAARGFETNQWEQADEAWAAMNAKNSKWYLRIGPDEVYFDPCQQKAGFHMALARINQSSLEWQKKLTPMRKKMERALADHIGKAYKARKVRFHMPDFIDVVQNAGDSRHPLGAVIGQSLPNWGKVAREGRGRTVVMTNFYTDADSKRISRLKARGLLSKATMKHYTEAQRPFLVNIILHEATHNFGPHSDYKVGGKTPKELFGGKLASTLEELKAQTGGLWYLQFLHKKKLIKKATLLQAYTQAISWCFGHISRGMFTPSGNVRPYSQLAAVQLGFFVKDGALTFKSGKFKINFKKLPGSIDKLMRKVGRIKARGDRAGAQKLIDHYVKGEGRKLVHARRIQQVVLRYPKATFYYSVKY